MNNTCLKLLKLIHIRQLSSLTNRRMISTPETKPSTHGTTSTFYWQSISYHSNFTIW